MMEFYNEAQELYKQGCYLEALIQLEKHQYGQSEEGGGESSKKVYFLALLISTDLSDHKKFKRIFLQMKESFLSIHGLKFWIGCLEEMLRREMWPEFFIRDQLVEAYGQSGQVEDLKRICREQIDRSLEKRRININLDIYKPILGEHVGAYRIVHHIYKGEYEKAMCHLKEMDQNKLKTVGSFIAANITPMECKRVEVPEIISMHLEKKRELSLRGHKPENIKAFKKAMIRNFINLIILDHDNKDHIKSLILFSSKIDNDLKEDIIEDVIKLFDQKKYEALEIEIKALGIEENHRENQYVDFHPEEGSDRVRISASDGAWSDCSEINEDETDFSVILKGVLRAQTDNWRVENFSEIMTEIMGFKLYRLGLDVIEKMYKDNYQKLDMTSVYYFQAEFYLAIRDFVNVLKICHEALKLPDIKASDHICFEYFTGEAYWALGKKKKACLSFKKVFKVNPLYRLVSERLESIEKN